jgi:hypothetical protein
MPHYVIQPFASLKRCNIVVEAKFFKKVINKYFHWIFLKQGSIHSNCCPFFIETFEVHHPLSKIATFIINELPMFYDSFKGCL